MNIPEWLKPGVYGAVVGAALMSAAGFSWGGWMTGAGAQRMADSMSRDDVIAALTPLCVDMARTDEDRLAKLATIKDAPSYKQRDAVMDAGWATIPGSDGPNRALAQACIQGLDLDAI